ncbi:hypothetical protein D3C72_833840 [compost metagenome]
MQGHIATVLNGRDDRRIGRRAADAALFHFLDQAGFGEARRWLGEVLARVDLDQLQRFALDHFRQHVVFARLALLRQHTGVTVKLEDTALGTQLEVARGHGDAGGQVLRWRHLAGQELAPDQLVQALGVALHASELARVGIHVGRTNRFVRLLGAFLAAVHQRCLGQVLLAELALDVAARHVQGVGRQVGGVGTHVGDVAGFVQALGHHHGFLHTEAQAVAGGLLQGGGNERCRRLAAGRAVFALDHAVAGSLELLQRGHGLGFVQRLEGLTLLACHFETHLGVLGGAEVGVDFPVLFRDERADFALALHHQLHRHRLYTAGGQATGDLGPQQRRNHVTDHAVEETPRLLRVDPVDIQLARLREGFLDGLLGDFVEHHALVAGVVAADGLAQVPGNGFPFAVQVGCEIDGVGVLRQAAQLFDHLFLARQDLVLGLPAVVGVDAHACHQLAAGLFLRRQGRSLTRGLATLGGWLFAGAGRTAGGEVSDMADTRLHHVLVAQVLVDGLGLGRGFHNDQRFAHGSEYS